jgi:predicted RNase H-like HicB family nuclease
MKKQYKFTVYYCNEDKIWIVKLDSKKDLVSMHGKTIRSAIRYFSEAMKTYVEDKK